MFKRLMIGLVAVGLVSIFIAEAANALVFSRRRSVGVIAKFGSDTDLTGATFNARIFGLPADADGRCGEIKGTSYCAQDGEDSASLGAHRIGHGEN